jgi:hypothetical protein
MTIDHFDLIPANELRVDQPDFKASVWKRNTRGSQVEFYSECFEWSGAKWEGFVSVRLRNDKPRTERPLPKCLTNALKQKERVA